MVRRPVITVVLRAGREAGDAGLRTPLMPAAPDVRDDRLR
jgi:hypothetical protein